MKIALFIHTLSGGGVERSAIRLARHFVEMGHAVDIVTFSGDGDMRQEAELAGTVYDLEAPWWIRRTLGYLRYLWKQNPDIVIAATPGPNMISSLANGILARRRPVIISQHGRDRVLYNPQQRRKAKILQKLVHAAYRRASAIVAVSAGVAEQLLAVPGMKREKIRVIYNPIWNPDIEAMAREGVAWEWSQDMPVVVTAGRLVVEKDYPTLLRAFAILRTRRRLGLLILGDGDLRGQLIEMANQLGISEDLSMPGFVRNPFAFLARADVFVLSSISEGLPTVVVEAMACGTPVVSTDCPSGPSEILDAGRYGALVPVGDPEALAIAIEKQLDNPTPANVLIARAREFSVEAAAKAYLSLASSLQRQ